MQCITISCPYFTISFCRMTFSRDAKAVFLELTVGVVVLLDSVDFNVVVSENVLALTLDKVVWFCDALEDSCDP